MNERQEKVIARLFKEGPNGFTGGLSAENYIAITGTSRPTATRDLHDLVENGALTRTGERRYMRCSLNLSGRAEEQQVCRSSALCGADHLKAGHIWRGPLLGLSMGVI